MLPVIDCLPLMAGNNDGVKAHLTQSTAVMAWNRRLLPSLSGRDNSSVLQGFPLASSADLTEEVPWVKAQSYRKIWSAQLAWDSHGNYRTFSNSVTTGQPWSRILGLKPI